MTPRLVFVLGKGGVGRTSLAAALAIRAGHAGKKALVVELNGVWDIGRRFGKNRSYRPVRIAENVSWTSMTTRDCMEDFGRTKLHLGRVGARLMSSRPLRAFVEAVPGLPDLLQLGKIENLLNSPAPGDPVYDLVIVDVPATGHGLSLLAAPQAMTEITESGPFHELAANIARALSAPDTGLVIATLAEELPYTETLELIDTLERSPLTITSVIVNRVVAGPLPDRSRWQDVRQAQSDAPDVQRLLSLVESVDAVAVEQESVISKLRRRVASTSIRLSTLPLLTSDGGVVSPRLLAQHLEST